MGEEEDARLARDDRVAVNVRADDDLEDVVLLERLGGGLLVGEGGREVLEDVVDGEGGRVGDACGTDESSGLSSSPTSSAVQRAGRQRQGVAPAHGGREGEARRTLRGALGLVVKGLDALLDELVALLAQLEDVGALDGLGEELLDDRLDDAGGRLVLVEGGGRDCQVDAAGVAGRQGEWCERGWGQR